MVGIQELERSARLGRGVSGRDRAREVGREEWRGNDARRGVGRSRGASWYPAKGWLVGAGRWVALAPRWGGARTGRGERTRRTYQASAAAAARPMQASVIQRAHQSRMLVLFAPANVNSWSAIGSSHACGRAAGTSHRRTKGRRAFPKAGVRRAARYVTRPRLALSRRDHP